MRIFAIKNEEDKKTLAYLLYYEKEKAFYIELPENADPWETPLILSSFAKKNITTVNSYWSRMWVQQRIVPSDRQNLGQVLKENKLSEYDEFELLMLSHGRCAQDELYLDEIEEKDIPKDIIKRFDTKIEDIVPLKNFNLLVFFRNGTIKKCNIKKFFEKNKALETFLTVNSDMFEYVQVQSGGYGIRWEENMSISDEELYASGRTIPLSSDDFREFVVHRVINSAEAAELLDCSRQNIKDLIRRNKLHPIKSTEKNTLFLKSEVMKRNWQ